MEIKRVAIYCGSSSGNNGVFKEQAEELAGYLVKNSIEMVNGGGKVGIMGIMADKMIELGGQCTGVIPLNLKEKELAHYGMSELVTSIGMHGRKRYIMDTCDAFIALPGGYGTLDEFFECLTWRQLNLHNGPVGMLNVNGYFNPLIDMLKNMKENGFVNGKSKNLLLHDHSIEGLFEKLKKSGKEEQNKWQSL